MRRRPSRCSGGIVFSFFLFSLQRGRGSNTCFYNNKILAPAGCSPNVTNIMVSAPVGPEMDIFPMCFFKQFLIDADFVDFAPLRSCYDSYGFVHKPISCCQKCYEFQMNFTNFTFCYYATFKNLALTYGFGHIFNLASLLLHVNGLLG